MANKYTYFDIVVMRSARRHMIVVSSTEKYSWNGPVKIQYE